MSARKIRRAAAHAARKAARKAGFPVLEQEAPPVSEITAAEAVAPSPAPETEPDHVIPVRPEISPARLAANKANAKLSAGALSPETQAICAQNHTIHGLARHQPGNLKILTSENPAGFEALKQSLTAEHQPSTETESILVNRMAESHWLETRAQRLQDTCIDPDTGVITDEKHFTLYMRYKTTQTRAFHKCLNDLLKLRSEKRKAELGLEAQRIKNERHELKKEAHPWVVMKADVSACRELSNLVNDNFVRTQANPDFYNQYTGELAKRGLETHPLFGATSAA